MTIREKVAQKLAKYCDQAAIKAHYCNIHTLYVLPEGRIYWSESPNGKPSRMIPGTRDPLAVLHRTGYGSEECLCSQCDRYEDPEDWAHDYDNKILEAMRGALHAIHLGYFDDEKGKQRKIK